MSETIYVAKVDEVYNKIVCETGIKFELQEYFTFVVPGYWHMPAYKAKAWDGKKRLFNPYSGLLYGGLLHHLLEFCKQRGYYAEIDPRLASDQLSIHEAEQFCSSLKIPEIDQVYEHQIKAFVTSVRDRRALLVSPTGSGKSLIAYLLVRYYDTKRFLIVVPTINLVHQLYTDFIDYGFDSDQHVHCVTAGVDKQTDKRITITTWQSIYKLPKKFFQQFDAIIGDEAHGFDAKSLIGIMEKCISVRYRYGMTGTLEDSKIHEWVLEGLFGRKTVVATTRELIDKGVLSPLRVKAIVLKHPDHAGKLLKGKSYNEERQFIIDNEARNNFIANLAVSMKDNTLVMFRYTAHGENLLELIREKAGKDRPIFFVNKDVEGEEREEIRKLIDNHTNAIGVTSTGTFATGNNIRNLHNIIPAHPSKGRIKILQSIGRALRLASKGREKTHATWYDIADDLTYTTKSGNPSKRNTTFLHFIERMKIYISEKFDPKIYNVQLQYDEELPSNGNKTLY